jgi:hypothetical protein
VGSSPRKAARQEVKFVPFGVVSLEDILKLPDPYFILPEDARRQLNYIDRYVRHPELGCRTVVLEEHYIDRDYIEDHSVFYSKSLTNYPNYCTRVHFFSLEPTQLQSEITRIRSLRSSAEEHVFWEECGRLSKRHYIGFAVIKPLPGCPVGRTVLRCLQEDSKKGHLRKFKCACDFDAHLLGLRFTVKGLPFQQQDLGVSACATTALWISLQRAAQLEHAGAATPAHITMRASQFALPFGRPMPSEGLSLDQMCQAIQSLGYSPNLHRAEGSSFEVTRALLFSSVSSGFSPVLVMENVDGSVRHAVAVAGVAVSQHTTAPPVTGVRHRSADLRGLYVHDDRCGPYLKATIAERKGNFLVRYELFDAQEEWTLTHILTPLHAKIRLSFGELYRAGADALTSDVQAFLNASGENESTLWRSRIYRSHVYVDELLQRVGASRLVEQLCRKVRLSRHIGVIRFDAPSLDTFDVLLDTTSTERNLNCLAVLQLQSTNVHTAELCRFIAGRYGGQYIH